MCKLIIISKLIILSVFLQLYQCKIVDNHIYDEYLYKWLILLIIVMQSLLQYYEFLCEFCI